jgi:hypothetical protein
MQKRKLSLTRAFRARNQRPDRAAHRPIAARRMNSGSSSYIRLRVSWRGACCLIGHTSVEPGTLERLGLVI